jgi:hypothetical protein
VHRDAVVRVDGELLGDLEYTAANLEPQRDWNGTWSYGSAVRRFGSVVAERDEELQAFEQRNVVSVSGAAENRAISAPMKEATRDRSATSCSSMRHTTSVTMSGRAAGSIVSTTAGQK